MAEHSTFWETEERLPVKPQTGVCAIALGDLHLGINPPKARLKEPSWFDAMARPLNEIKELQQQHGNVPCILAGDVLHRWHEPAELVNWALKALPDNCWAVAGNHELPNHQLKDVKKSAFWTLVEAGKVKLLTPEPVGLGHLNVRGFSWGQVPEPLTERHSLTIEVAVVHAYVWNQATGYPGAAPSCRLKAWLKRLKGYDLAITGDNHETIHHEREGFTLFNSGSMMRRNVNQANHRPCVGLVGVDGKVTKHYLDCSADVLAEPDGLPKVAGIDSKGFLAELEKLGEAGVDFKAAMLQRLRDETVLAGVRGAIIEAMEGA